MELGMLLERFGIWLWRKGNLSLFSKESIYKNIIFYSDLEVKKSGMCSWCSSFGSGFLWYMLLKYLKNSLSSLITQRSSINLPASWYLFDLGDPRKTEFLNKRNEEAIKTETCLKWSKVYFHCNTNVLFRHKVVNCWEAVFIIRKETVCFILCCVKIGLSSTLSV